MKILLLEDNLYTAEYLEILINLTIKGKAELVVCNDIYEANDKIEENQDIICIISDLNMNPDGLDIQKYIETEATYITGWIWVKCNVLNNTTLENIPIIFYSAFIDDFKKSSAFDEVRDINSIQLISKEEENSEKTLCERIECIIEENLA